MTWVDNISRAKPTYSTDDEYILGYGHGVEGAVAEIKKQHSSLAIALLDDKSKLAYAISTGGYCPGDFYVGLPSCNLECDCIPEKDRCNDCWKEYLGGGTNGSSL